MSKWTVMAHSHVILKGTVGSKAYGLNLDDNTDRDEMGVVLETVEAALGFSEFEQEIFRTAALREGKHDAKSAAGDLDLTLYSLKKFLRLAMQGNPSVLQLLYIKDASEITDVGRQLQELAPSIISRQAGNRFLGYMESQRQRLLGERGQKKVNRPELEEKYGFDTKYAMHIIRLGYQGVELLKTGTMTLPLPEKDRERILSIRTGGMELSDVLQWAGDLERELKDLLDTSWLPEEPDRERVEKWMLETYLNAWRKA